MFVNHPYQNCLYTHPDLNMKTIENRILDLVQAIPRSKMYCKAFVLVTALIYHISAVKVKVVMHSEEDSKFDEEYAPQNDEHKSKTVENTISPHANDHKRAQEKVIDFEEVKFTTEAVAHHRHPNELIFPLIYRQNHINSMFKVGEKWYTWSIEKQNDGTKSVNYYVCYDEPKLCDEVGWETTDSVPKCAFQIDFLMPEDRVCVNNFGVEPHSSGTCERGEQLKVSEMVKLCGSRIRSLWRFVRVGRRPVNAAKPADVNSLLCEDEEECFITIEYRVHYDRITFSLHEPSRGQTFKSALKRDLSTKEENAVKTAHIHKNKKAIKEEMLRNKKRHFKIRSKLSEGKGLVKENDDVDYSRKSVKNEIKTHDDVSANNSE